MKKFIFTALLVSLIAVSGLTVFAADLSMDEVPQKTMEFVKGKVISVEATARNNTGEYQIKIEDSKSAPYVFAVDTDSYNAGETAVTDIKPGDSFIGWYDPKMASIMIYPPQYRAVVYAVNMEAGIAAVDVFDFKPDGDMISRSGDLVLRMEELNKGDTPAYGPEVDGKLLVVYSDFIMESFPAQTTPNKIVALDYEPQQLIAEPSAPGNFESGYYVNGNKIDASAGYSVSGVTIDRPMYYGNEQSDMMIPLRAAAEAMGYAVHWEEEMQAVILNNNVTVKIGSNEYSIARMASVSLNSAAEVIDGITYVPHTFFSEILKASVNITDNGNTWRVDINSNQQ